MSYRVVAASKKLHKAFEDIFKGGGENRQMMHSEASAAILQVVSRCTEMLRLLGKYSNYAWSAPLMQNAENIKHLLQEEFSLALINWRQEKTIEKLVSMKNTFYNRITLANAPGFQYVIDEETALMHHIDAYSEMSKTSNQSCDTNAGTLALHCEALVFRIARLAFMMIAIIDGKAAGKIRAHIEEPIFNTRRAFLGIATDKQKFEILYRLQEEKGLDSKEVLLLSQETILVMSHGVKSEDYHGFIIADTPFYTTAADKKTVVINHIEFASSHTETNLGREVVRWMTSTARGNGFKLLSTNTLKPSKKFWLDCGFDVREGSGIATYDLDPMSIENIVNRT
jgi:hypothetical protein